MIIPVMAVFGLLLPAALGGHLSRLAGVRLRRLPVLISAFAAQFLVISVLEGPDLLLKTVHIATYALGAWVLWANRRVPGLPLIGLGTLTNGITIAANGGTLPASPAALTAAGMASQTGFVNSGTLAHPHLAVLGDIFAVPAAWPLSNVFSIGDILIVTGATYAALGICGTSWTPPWTVPVLHQSTTGRDHNHSRRHAHSPRKARS